MPIIKRHQTLLDFATQQVGSAEGLAGIALDNDLSITEDVAGGTALNANDVIDTKVAAQLATQDIASKDNEAQGVGIDYWRIGIDFEIG